MRTFKRICISDWEVTADNGDYFEVKRGKEYLTSDKHQDGTVTVFGRFWARVPERHFVSARLFTT